MAENCKVILLILDGWGYRSAAEHNAITLSNPINFNALVKNEPNILIETSGEDVGLPEGQMGNSEVGHTNIGAGRIVFQDLVRISKSFENGSAQKNETFVKFLDSVTTGRVHILGLLSDGGVHSHIEHIKHIISAVKDYENQHKRGINQILIHAVLDGRDTPPQSGRSYVEELENWMKENSAGKIVDITGRFYCMDRDKRWDRVEKAYSMLRFAKANMADSALSAVNASYAKNITDEFLLPTVIKGTDGEIKDGDGLFFINFRADRMREILAAFYKDEFKEFDRGEKPKVNLLTISPYDESMPAPAMFCSESLKNILGEVIANAGLKQLRIAETEKYAHVTYFFNGGREEPFPLEERILVASPRDVATYDLKPEMSVYEVVEKFEKRYSEGDLSLVVMNFANPDMVGHTGVESAAAAACAAVDKMIGKIVEIADKHKAALLICADHGNSEEMWDYENSQPHTAHTLNPVRLILRNSVEFKAEHGKLADIAPTILKIMGIPIPSEMTGKVLI